MSVNTDRSGVASSREILPGRLLAQRNRLQQGGRLERSQPLHFTFNGKPMTGYQGDTLASALLANNVSIVGRSFKYSRARGIMTAGVEEPNAIVQVGSSEATQTPNVKATEQMLYDGLVSRSVNGWPSAEHDLMELIGSLGSGFMSPGFYYKTFMWPQSRWESYEKLIRKAAGLGRCPTVPDADQYEHINHHCDVCVIGAGPAGLLAARTAAQAGARVLLADEQAEAGGALLYSGELIDDKPAMQWVADVLAQLHEHSRVTILNRATVNGYHDHNFLTISERCTDHSSDRAPAGYVRQRLHKIRAASVVLATGAHERPLVFSNNDRPGCMIASSVSHYIRRFAVVPGQKLVLMTCNDGAYQAAFDWADADREVIAIIDSRPSPDGAATDQARERGIRIVTGAAVIEATGRKRVNGALVAPISPDASNVTGLARHFDCDTIAMSGGWSPVVHLASHTGSRPVWSDQVNGFLPGETRQPCWFAGSVLGSYSLHDCFKDGLQAGRDASMAAGHTNPTRGIQIPSVRSDNNTLCQAMALFHVPHRKPVSRAPKQFVDLQNDVTAAGIQMSIREGFESIEHVKRYTAMGFGTDQGKTGNINGMAIVARTLGQSIADTGTTVFRPNYTPVSFGAVAGAHTGALFDPERYSPMHAWHLEQGAKFEDVGQWKRPWYYPRGEETMAQAIAREQLAVRNEAGVLDASTLGKIDIQGTDAREFLSRVYTNAWQKLKPGHCRYGLMCGEDGMVMDDGVTSCITDNHFLMTTTTGGAAHVLSWLELYHQTEWSDLDVFFTSVTEHWATMAVAGPEVRKLLEPLVDIDLSERSFGFMQWREALFAGIPARLFRISFTGELSFEINVPAHYALDAWKALFKVGEAYNLTPYGTETMHVLRAEKGFIIVGQDTDGSMTPYDIDHGWAVAEKKDFSFIGKRGMRRSDCLSADRKQLVGLETVDPLADLPEGAQAVRSRDDSIPMQMVGHVTSSYYSAFLKRRIALAVIRDGLQRMGETLYFPLSDGQIIEARICPRAFLDPESIRQNP